MAGCVAAALVVGLVVVPAGSTHRSPATLAVPGPSPAARLAGAVVSFDDCAGYLSYVKQKAEAEVGAYGLLSSPPGFDGYGFGIAVPEKVAAGATNAASAAPASAATAQGSGLVLPGTYSLTNDQVAGVDEPDTVKTNGGVVVTLSGGTLRVLDTGARVIGTLQLTGDTGGGLLLAGDQVLVLSSPATTAVGTVSSEPPVYNNGPVVYSSGPAVRATPLTTAQVAVVDLSDPTRPQLVRTFHFDGSIVAARLVDGRVSLVLRSDGPRLSFVYPSPTSGDTGAAIAANKQLIADSTLADWLPSWQVESPDGAVTARQPLTACDAVARPDQASGISTVTVVSLDPHSAIPGAGTSIVAAGSTVYETAAHLYVAGAAAGPDGAVPAGQQSGCCSVAPPVGASTRIYSFDTSATGAVTFVGSASVPGWLIDSYAMDEDAQGRLRVASTSTADGTSQSQITVLAPGAGGLTTVGSVAGLGRGEYIRAVRFIGAQAYVVTFQTFDPLYIVDLSNPTEPVLAGRLDQPGFSEFLYPLPGHRLLGVGVQITANEPSGLLVATYDVSDPSHPTRIDESVLAEGFYDQSFDPHAFVYWPPVQLALLAVPGGPPGPSGPSGPSGGGTGVAAYQVGSAGQLSRTATLGHGGETATRSLVLGDQVWVITADGVVTSPLTDLPATTWHAY